MKYGRLENENLLIKEVENGIEVGGSLTEQQIIEMGYKPVCEIEKPTEADFFVYKEYDACFVQIWKKEGEEIQEDEIWTSDSGIMPKYTDLERLKSDVIMVTSNINSINLSNKEVNDVVEFLPKWEDYIGKSLTKGFKVQYKNKPYKVLKGLSNIVANHTPDITKSEYGLVSEHDGTKDDAIPYEHWMLIEKDVYYTENGKLYIGLMDAPNGYDADLSTLATLAKEVKE